MYLLAELGYILICQLKGEKCTFGNALAEKSESWTRSKNGLVEELSVFMWFRMSKLQDRHSGNLQDAFVSCRLSSLSWNIASGRICCWIYRTFLNAESTDISKKSLNLSLVTICKYDQIANFAVVRSNIRVAWGNVGFVKVIKMTNKNVQWPAILCAKLRSARVNACYISHALLIFVPKILILDIGNRSVLLLVISCRILVLITYFSTA